ncbi:Ig-like domain-containing protein [uncultured Methanobrevibacter sp.]|uniref:Ig-like domain-containing protein n=1 Tax=uncultured Methanobrevibacter sp. TaxID=253161 RepID=UPI0025DCD437|nr:Ig-like domain-containing protein [uncultured Methanobrevibacter sp.]
MKYKKSLIIFALIIFIFGIASVCASDANTVVASVDGQASGFMIINEIESNNVASDDSQILGLSNSNEILKEPTTVTNHTFDAIESAINEGYDTIYLEPGIYTGKDVIGITEKENINIIGNSTILDAHGQTGILLISDSRDVIIRDITFVNGNYESGGAILASYCANVQIIDCTFTNNTASQTGGAISAPLVNLQVINSSFTNNKADSYGGAIYWASWDMKIEGSIFTNNTAEGNSIICGQLGSGQITTSIFTNNHADAVIDTDNQLKVNNNIFLNNNGTSINFDMDDCNGDYNWFGHNQSNYKDNPGIKFCSKWLFLNGTANPDIMSVADTSNITFTIWSYDSDNNNSGEYDKNLLKPVDLTITATNGDVSSNTAKFGDTITYTATKGGTAGVTASIEENVVDTIPLNINKENPNLSVVDEEVPYAENTALTLNYSSAATGKVNITLNGKKHNEIFTDLDLNSTINLEGILPDEYDVMVIYSGDDSFLNATASGRLTVAKLDSNITVQSYDINVTDGDGLMFKVTLPKNATGNMTLSNGKIIDVSKEGKKGKKVLTVEIRNDEYSVGEYEWTFNYLGDDIYKNSTDQATSNILIIQTKIIPENKTIEMIFDDKSKINYTTEPDDIKEITFESTNTSVVTVNSKGIIKAVGAGKAQIIILFKGDENYTACNATVAVTVKKIATVIKPGAVSYVVYIDDTRDNLAVLQDEDGNNVTDEYTLTYTSGNESVVKIVDDSFVAVGAGTTTITVSFNGNDKYEAADIVIFNVGVFKIPTEILIQNNTLDMEVGDVADPVVSLMPSDAGNLTFISHFSGIVSVDNKGIVTAVGEGSSFITVRFDGNDKYVSSSATISVTVSKVAFDPEITVNDTNVAVSVPENATGGMTLAIGNETFVAYIKYSIASFDLSDVPPGDYNTTITYYGDEKYARFEVVYPISIENKFILSVDDLIKYYGGPERFVVNITDRKFNPIANANVIIYINDQNYTRVTDDKGQASMAINLNAGEYPTVVTYNGTSVDATVTVLSTVNGTDIVKMHRNETQYFATFRDCEGNYLKDGEAVWFNINGVIYERKVSGDKGLARLNINLNPGQYVITAMNLVTKDMSSNKVIVLSRIVENTDLTKYYRNASQYTVKILGYDGKPVGAGETVRFNINGVFYERQTNGSGIAKLNINLQPRNYIITAEYQGAMESNNIIVLPILNATDITMKYHDGTQFKVTLVDGHGKPYAGETVSFNVNGIFYNKVTDSSGIAKLNINLMPGEYIITSSYGGTSIANKITIKS